MSRPTLGELHTWVMLHVPNVPTDELGGYKPREELSRLIQSVAEAAAEGMNPHD